MNKQTMKRISTWGKVLGIISMISGGISAVIGMFAFVIGAIPGVITVIIGYYLYKTGKSAAEYLLSEDESSIENLLESYAKYLFIQGILLIVGLALVILMVLIGGIGIFSIIAGLS